MLAIYILIALIVLVLSFIGIAAYIGSEKLLRVSETWYAVKLKVLAVTEDTITIPRREETILPGTYGLAWQDNYAIVGDILSSDTHTITRRLIKTTQPISVDMLVTWNIFAYQGNPKDTLDLAYEEVHVPSELGSLPVWFVPGRSSTWMLLFHGFHASREEGLRALSALTQLGFPVLLMSYRNDAGAPLSPDHFYHLGDTEWRDVEAGVRYALTQGAENIVLFGWSMGGCMIETFLRRSPEASKAQAVILDAPVLNWHDALDTQMRKLHFPQWLIEIIKWTAAKRAGIDFSALNNLSRSGVANIPTLLFHGTSDGMVPIKASDTLAQRHPDLISYMRVGNADHTQAWNVAPQAYEDALKVFLSRFVATHELH